MNRLRHSLPGRKLLAAALTLASLAVSASAAVAAELNFFNPGVSVAVPAEIRAFVNRYLSERISSPADAARRMEFDEVEATFPLRAESAAMVAGADGLALSLHDGRRYSIVWTRDSVVLGAVSFPASYSLIRGIGQRESFDSLVRRLRGNTRETSDSLRVRPLALEPAPGNVLTRPGSEFYLGHLTTHTYIDAANSRPVWAAGFPAESLANLFLLPQMPGVSVDLAMVNYEMDTVRVATSTASASYLLGPADGSQPYFGISHTDPATGTVTAVVIYHNPAYAYLHKLEVTASPAQLFDPGAPRLKAVLHPYIKLHNLSDLWGEKQRQHLPPSSPR